MEFTIKGNNHIDDYTRHRPQAVIRVEQTQAVIRLTPRHENELTNSAKNNKLGKTIVVLDHIVDPHNLGAVVRSAAFFGVKALIIAKRRQVTLTQAVVNAAAGGFALLDLYLVTNLSRTLENLKGYGFWLIGADLQGETLVDKGFAKKILLFGAESKGLSKNLRNKCDCLMKIPNLAPAPQSLNVSVAAAIFLYQQHNNPLKSRAL